MCIPRVDAGITKEYITKTINSLNIGYIRQIREIPLKNDPTHKRVLMRFHWRENNDNSITLQKQLVDLGSLKIVHDMPWYWKLVVAQ